MIRALLLFISISGAGLQGYFLYLLQRVRHVGDVAALELMYWVSERDFIVSHVGSLALGFIIADFVSHRELPKNVSLARWVTTILVVTWLTLAVLCQFPQLIFDE